MIVTRQMSCELSPESKAKIPTFGAAMAFLLAIGAGSINLPGQELKNMKTTLLTLAIGALALNATAWDYDGHHAINTLALTSLPRDFGIQFSPELKERVAFLAGEPDRW